MKLTKKIGAWVFEVKTIQARRVGLDGEFGDDFDSVAKIHQINLDAHVEGFLTTEDFTRCDYKAFQELCENMGLTLKFKRSRDIV